MQVQSAAAGRAGSGAGQEGAGQAPQFRLPGGQIIDDADRIEKWIERVRHREGKSCARVPNNPQASPAPALTCPGATGWTVERADYDAHGMGTTASEVLSAQVTLKYQKGMAPSVVITSYPVPPEAPGTLMEMVAS